jgi:C_GCAxxG_C_C family probable redox protein
MTDFTNSPKAKKAEELFRMGYNCSQAVVGAWADDIGLTFETAVKISSGFGGGMGRMREVCGAVTGAFTVLGAKFSDGSANPQDKKNVYELVQKFAARFKEENGFDSIICRELLGLPNLKSASDPTPAARTGEYYKKRPCPELVALSAALLEEFIP